MKREFEFLKRKYKLHNLSVYFDSKFLASYNIEANFDYVLFQITLKDRRICKRRLLSLLHEMCHAIQFKQKRLIANKRDTRKMYLLEVEAEYFAISEYKKFFAKKYGRCNTNEWNLASYEDYKKIFKNYTTVGYGRR